LGYWSKVLKPRGYQFDGGWRIANGSFIGKVRGAGYRNFTNAIVLGQETSSKILDLDDRELIKERTKKTEFLPPLPVLSCSNNPSRFRLNFP
jgi:hypothetical protein